MKEVVSISKKRLETLERREKILKELMNVLAEEESRVENTLKTCNETGIYIIKDAFNEKLVLETSKIELNIIAKKFESNLMKAGIKLED